MWNKTSLSFYYLGVYNNYSLLIENIFFTSNGTTGCATTTGAASQLFASAINLLAASQCFVWDTPSHAPRSKFTI